MRAILDWLIRLESLTAESAVQATPFRVIVSGPQSLDLDNWIMCFEPQGRLASSPGVIGDESWSVVRLLDQNRSEVNLHERHRLGAELAAAVSLALDRRVVIPNDVAFSVPGLQQIIFQPSAHVVDPCILGSLPSDVGERLRRFFSVVRGLPEGHLDVLGAAASAHHSAVLLFDKEPRVAYTLLVAGIETLSRKYGAPPTDWQSWAESSDWDREFNELGLAPEKATRMRERLMRDRQLRLGATFQEYGSSRPENDFWSREVDEWMPALEVDDNVSRWLPPTKSSRRRVSHFVPTDRVALKKALAKSYNLRSAVVHESTWLELMAIAGPISGPPGGDRALSFPGLRLLLAELINLELSAHSSAQDLADVALQRSPSVCGGGGEESSSG